MRCATLLALLALLALVGCHSAPGTPDASAHVLGAIPPYGPAGNCDAGSAICGTFPGNLKVNLAARDGQVTGAPGYHNMDAGALGFDAGNPANVQLAIQGVAAEVAGPAVTPAVGFGDLDGGGSGLLLWDQPVQRCHRRVFGGDAEAACEWTLPANHFCQIGYRVSLRCVSDSGVGCLRDQYAWGYEPICSTLEEGASGILPPLSPTDGGCAQPMAGFGGPDGGLKHATCSGFLLDGGVVGAACATGSIGGVADFQGELRASCN